MEGWVWSYGNQANWPVNKLLMCQSSMHQSEGAGIGIEQCQLATYVKIEIICVQSVQGFLKTLLDVRLMGVPELARQKDFLTRQATVLDTLADLMFVA
jgi:hypothetical protein